MLDLVIVLVVVFGLVIQSACYSWWLISRSQNGLVMRLWRCYSTAHFTQFEPPWEKTKTFCVCVRVSGSNCSSVAPAATDCITTTLKKKSPALSGSTICIARYSFIKPSSLSRSVPATCINHGLLIQSVHWQQIQHCGWLIHLITDTTSCNESNNDLLTGAKPGHSYTVKSPSSFSSSVDAPESGTLCSSLCLHHMAHTHRGHESSVADILSH